MTDIFVHVVLIENIQIAFLLMGCKIVGLFRSNLIWTALRFAFCPYLVVVLAVHRSIADNNNNLTKRLTPNADQSHTKRYCQCMIKQNIEKIL